MIQIEVSKLIIHLKFVDVASGGNVNPARGAILIDLIKNWTKKSNIKPRKKWVLMISCKCKEYKRKSAYMESKAGGLEVSRRWVL